MVAEHGAPEGDLIVNEGTDWLAVIDGLAIAPDLLDPLAVVAERQPKEAHTSLTGVDLGPGARDGHPHRGMGLLIRLGSMARRGHEKKRPL